MSLRLLEPALQALADIGSAGQEFLWAVREGNIFQGSLHSPDKEKLSTAVNISSTPSWLHQKIFQLSKLAIFWDIICNTYPCLLYPVFNFCFKVPKSFHKTLNSRLDGPAIKLHWDIFIFLMPAFTHSKLLDFYILKANVFAFLLIILEIGWIAISISFYYISVPR